MRKKTRAERRLEFEALVRENGYARACELRAHQISLIRSRAAKKRHAEGKGSYAKQEDFSVVEMRQALALHKHWIVKRERTKGIVGGYGAWTATNGVATAHGETGTELVFALMNHGVDIRRAMGVDDPTDPYNLVGGQLPDIL